MRGSEGTASSLVSSFSRAIKSIIWREARIENDVAVPALESDKAAACKKTIGSSLSFFLFTKTLARAGGYTLVAEPVCVCFKHSKTNQFDLKKSCEKEDSSSSNSSIIINQRKNARARWRPLRSTHTGRRVAAQWPCNVDATDKLRERESIFTREHLTHPLRLLLSATMQ